MTATPQRAFLLYFPAHATFYHVDDLAIAETIIAAHWGVYGEVSQDGKVIVGQACHDVATINAARRMCDALNVEQYRSELRFLCV